MEFSELDLHPKLKKGLEKKEFVECTPIQEMAIPPILEGKDVAGLAQTGTGKTAAFLLPILDRIYRAMDEPPDPRGFKNWRSTNFILILVPTRELAEQVYANFVELSDDLKGVAIYGGTSYDPQKQALHAGVEFVIATPGRLIDLFKDHLVDLSQVRAVIFDEADRMFDMGFKDDMRYILKRIPRDRQFLVFSATLNFDVLNVAYESGADPIELNASRDQAKAENVDDELYHLGTDEKPGHLLSLLKKHEPRQVIIFSNFKNNVERVAHFLTSNGMPAMGISSLLSQKQRQRVMEQFKAEGNDRNILVATDVAARGLDIQGVDLVVNYELPDDPENYVHRIGRTGRAGEKGLAISLVSDRDVDALARVEEFLDHKVRMGWLEADELVEDFEAFPRGDVRPKYDKDPRQRRQKEKSAQKGPRKRNSQRKDRPQRSAKSGNEDPSGKKRNRRPRKRNNENKNNEDKNNEDKKSSQPTAKNAEEPTHRDRRAGGRHQKPNRSRPPSKSKEASKSTSQNGSPRKSSKKNTTLVRKGGKSKGPYRGGRYRVENQSKKGIGKKISGLLKGWFK